MTHFLKENNQKLANKKTLSYNRIFAGHLGNFSAASLSGMAAAAAAAAAACSSSAGSAGTMTLSSSTAALAAAAGMTDQVGKTIFNLGSDRLKI